MLFNIILIGIIGFTIAKGWPTDDAVDIPKRERHASNDISF